MIIVTGGAGFIGSAIISALNGRGIDDILVVDILGNDEKWKNLRALRYADYVEAPEFLAMLSADKIDWDVEAVFHMGACSATTVNGSPTRTSSTTGRTTGTSCRPW